jgi:hypothetical protein
MDAKGKRIPCSPSFSVIRGNLAPFHTELPRLYGILRKKLSTASQNSSLNKK